MHILCSTVVSNEKVSFLLVVLGVSTGLCLWKPNDTRTISRTTIGPDVTDSNFIRPSPSVHEITSSIVYYCMK